MPRSFVPLSLGPTEELTSPQRGRVTSLQVPTLVCSFRVSFRVSFRFHFAFYHVSHGNYPNEMNEMSLVRKVSTQSAHHRAVSTPESFLHFTHFSFRVPRSHVSHGHRRNESTHFVSFRGTLFHFVTLQHTATRLCGVSGLDRKSVV